MNLLFYLIVGISLLIIIYNLSLIFKWSLMLFIIAHLFPSKKVWRVLHFNSFNYKRSHLLTKEEARRYAQKTFGEAYIDYENGEW